MAIPYVTGPVHMFVGVGEGYSPLYLGTGERAPSIELLDEFEPVPNDIAGGKIPLDECYQGEHGFVTIDLNRFNEPVYELFTAIIRGASPGRQPFGTMGSLMQLEGHNYPLWLVFPYQAKPVFRDAGMPAGYHFFSTHLLGPQKLEPLGTVARKIRLVWHCMRVFDPNTGDFYLYDGDTSGLPSIN